MNKQQLIEKDLQYWQRIVSYCGLIDLVKQEPWAYPGRLLHGEEAIPSYKAKDPLSGSVIRLGSRDGHSEILEPGQYYKGAKIRFASPVPAFIVADSIGEWCRTGFFLSQFEDDSEYFRRVPAGSKPIIEILFEAYGDITRDVSQLVEIARDSHKRRKAD